MCRCRGTERHRKCHGFMLCLTQLTSAQGATRCKAIYRCIVRCTYVVGDLKCNKEVFSEFSVQICSDVSFREPSFDSEVSIVKLSAVRVEHLSLEWRGQWHTELGSLGGGAGNGLPRRGQGPASQKVVLGTPPPSYKFSGPPDTPAPSARPGESRGSQIVPPPPSQLWWRASTSAACGFLCAMSDHLVSWKTPCLTHYSSADPHDDKY